MSTIVWDGNKVLEEHWNFTDNLPVAEIIESQTSKSCKDSNILIFIRCNKMEFQDWMEELFHIILLQKYEYALYFTIEERRFYQQRKKRDIWGKATKKSNSRQAGTIFQIFLAVASQTNSSMQKEERKQSSAKSIGPQTPKKLHSIKYEKTYNDVKDGLPIPHHTNTSNTN